MALPMPLFFRYFSRSRSTLREVSRSPRRLRKSGLRWPPRRVDPAIPLIFPLPSVSLAARCAFRTSAAGRPRGEPATARGAHKRPSRQRIDPIQRDRLGRLRVQSTEKREELGQVNPVATDGLGGGPLSVQLPAIFLDESLHRRPHSDRGGSSSPLSPRQWTIRP